MCVTESTSGRKKRWRSVSRGLLVTLTLICPLVYSTGACCSTLVPSSSSPEVGKAACACCQHEDQRSRSPRSVPSPHMPACQCASSTAPVIVPVIVSVPRQGGAGYRDVVGGESPRHHQGSSSLCPVADGVSSREVWGRRLCVSHGVLIC